MNAARDGRGPLLRPSRAPFTSSGRFTPILIGLLCLILVGISWERGRGNFHRLTTAVLPAQPAGARPTGPGGEDAIHLTRTPDAVSGEPEFLSATLLPGRGMNLLQLTAVVPGHGEIPLLMAPSLATAGSMLTDTGADANGSLSATMGGAFLIPWADRLNGKPASTPGVLQTLWLGQRLTFPASQSGSLLSTLGLMLDRAADSTHVGTVLGGQSVEAVFHPGTFSGNWPSTGSVHILAELAQHSLDLTVTVENTGDSPMPVGVGWLPYFSIASQDRADATLTIPSSTILQIDRGTGLPTGQMTSVAGTSLDFTSSHGTRLGSKSIDATYAHLSPGILDDRPIVELRDTSFGYGLRITPLSNNIRAFRIVAPADKPWVAVAPDTNYDDPLGSEWNTSEGSGIVTLQAGDSLQWKVRVEIFTFTPQDHVQDHTPDRAEDRTPGV